MIPGGEALPSSRRILDQDVRGAMDGDERMRTVMVFGTEYW
jgi:hypothetical protein